MTKNFKRITAIILAIVVIATTFVACKGKTEDEGTNPTVNGTTQAEGWSENTTKKDDEASTGSSPSQSTTESTTKKETTTAKKETTTKKVTTTKRNSNNGGNRPTVAVTTRPAPKPTTTKPTTQPAKRTPLTQAQKDWYIQNTFAQYPKYGAAPGFYLEDRNREWNPETAGTNMNSGLEQHATFYQEETGPFSYQGNAKAVIEDCKSEYQSAKGITFVSFWWEDTDKGSTLWAKEWHN